MKTLKLMVRSNLTIEVVEGNDYTLIQLAPKVMNMVVWALAWLVYLMVDVLAVWPEVTQDFTLEIAMPGLPDLGGELQILALLIVHPVRVFLVGWNTFMFAL